jgi:hypothetical protein
MQAGLLRAMIDDVSSVVFSRNTRDKLGVTWTGWGVLAVAALIGAAVVTLLAPKVDDVPVSSTPTRDLTSGEQTALVKALSPGLNQPATVQWRWLPLSTQTFENGQGRYCGFLNAKDASGKELGFQPFLAAVTTARGRINGGELALVATDDQALQTVRRMCAQSGYEIP